MKRKRFHLAQANIARMRAPLESPIMEGFRSQLDRINAIADSSRGFVWRLQTDAGNATAIRAYEDDRILFNMSVWESLEALRSGGTANTSVGQYVLARTTLPLGEEAVTRGETPPRGR